VFVPEIDRERDNDRASRSLDHPDRYIHVLHVSGIYPKNPGQGRPQHIGPGAVDLVERGWPALSISAFPDPPLLGEAKLLPRIRRGRAMPNRGRRGWFTPLEPERDTTQNNERQDDR
jgi:hypothetical protein